MSELKKTAKPRLMVGCISLYFLGPTILILVVIGFVANALLSSKTIPAPSPQPPSLTSPGHNVTLSSGTSKPAVMAADADAMHDLVTIEADNDSEGLQRLVEGGHAFVIPAGTKAFSMEDVGEDTTKIRIEEGQYTGQEGIIQNELIHGIE